MARRTADAWIVLNALDTSTDMATLLASLTPSGGATGVAVMGVVTPCSVRLEDPAETFLVRRRMVSPMAIGRKEPLGSRRAIMEATQTYGRTASGTSPWRRRLTTSERSRRRRSEEAGRVASRICEGRSPDRPAPEVDGKERRAVRTWSTSAVGAAPAPTSRNEFMSARSPTGGPGWRRRREGTTSFVG